MTPLELALSRLSDVRKVSRGYLARCPAHSDRSPSLSIATGHDGRVLLTCRAGCNTADVLAAMDLRWSDLFAASARVHVVATKPPYVSTYAEISAELVARERRIQERRTQWRELQHVADEGRAVDRLVARARTVVTALGEGNELGWELARQAALLETLMAKAEADAQMGVAGRLLW